jgi:Phage head-tail joining protein
MRDPFAAAAGALFRAAGSAAAVHTPAAGGASTEIRIIRRQPEGRTFFGKADDSFVTRVIEIQRSAVEAPGHGDTVIADGDILAIAGEPQLDPEGLTWLCEVPVLDHAVALLRQGRVRDAGGDWVDGFASIATDIPAAVRFGPGRETIVEGQSVAWIEGVFRIVRTDLVADLKPRDRLTHRGQAFDITAIAELGRGAGLEIHGLRKVD